MAFPPPKASPPAAGAPPAKPAASPPKGDDGPPPGPFAAACQAIAIAAKMPGAADCADTLAKIELAFQPDGAIKVALDGKGFMVPAKALGLGDDASGGPASGGAKGGGDAFPPPPPTQM